MKKILLIGTGGTIASTSSERGLVPGISPEGILKYVPEISKLCEVDALQIFNIDSTNVTPEHWLGIAKTIKENYEKYDGFIVCHGTDTMAYSAAAISYLVQNSPKPIVFTGSQKPIDKEDARRMISLLSGKVHQVYTGVTLSLNGKVKTFSEKTDVEFFDLTEDEIEEYISSSEPYDKAGAYGIQGKAGLLVKGINGDYYNVVGFPVARLKREIQEFLSCTTHR